MFFDPLFAALRFSGSKALKKFCGQYSRISVLKESFTGKNQSYWMIGYGIKMEK